MPKGELSLSIVCILENPSGSCTRGDRQV